MKTFFSYMTNFKFHQFTIHIVIWTMIFTKQKSFLDEPITFTTTERGKLMLIFKNYPFLKEKTHDGKITWVCRQKAALQ
jgi:FLYWCH zinc finger domain